MNKPLVILALVLQGLSCHALAQQAPQVIKLEDTIQGNQEQPKVLTIVPWQSPSVAPSLPSQVSERINKRFAPLEREEFSRQLQFLTLQLANSYSEPSLKP